MGMVGKRAITDGVMGKRAITDGVMGSAPTLDGRWATGQGCVRDWRRVITDWMMGHH